MLSEIENSIKVTNEKIKSVKKFKKTGIEKEIKVYEKKLSIVFIFYVTTLIVIDYI